MRPILVQIPSKLLFFIALALAVVLFARDLLNRRRVPGAKLGANPLLLVAGALALVKYRSPTASFIPEVGTFSQAWLPVPIYSYGVMLGTSMIIGWFLAMRNAKQDGLSTEAAGAIYMWSAVYSIIGARVLYVLTNLEVFTRDPLEIVKVNNGGLVAYGGIIGGVLASWYGCHKRKIPLLKWGDVGAPSVVLGTGITRMGCFLFGLLMYLRRVRRFTGEVFLAWIIGYGILRPIIEVLRDDDQRGNVGPLSTSQFIGLVSVVLGTALLLQLIRRYRRDPGSLRLWETPVGTPAPAGGPSGSSGPVVSRGGAGPSGARKRRKRR